MMNGYWNASPGGWFGNANQPSAWCFAADYDGQREWGPRANYEAAMAEAASDSREGRAA